MRFAVSPSVLIVLILVFIYLNHTSPKDPS